MKITRLLPLLLLLISNTFLHAQLVSPSQFLGYELGEQFSHHHQVVDYFENVSENSNQVKLIEYGKTNEGRPLVLAYISSENNIKNLENIRIDNLKRAKLVDGKPSENVGVVWLSYNVHGNESSSTEAAMNSLYKLLTDGKFEKYLENTVVLMDPCINPDGRERYVHFYEQWKNQNYNPNGEAAEHKEPWPGGRENHYLFDLNRDWAWQTQVESQQRMKLYNQWMPQIHVDFHEQFINNPYYFAPAASPYHELISKWQRDFQGEIGKNHAKYFDENGWMYFTGEVFDLLYPSYGDTYPTFNGAIGMTYEQAGHGQAGLGINTADGQVLTLKDRIAHHTTTGLSTVEMASKQNAKMINEFEKYFNQSVNGELGKYKSFVIKNTNQDRISHLTNWLDQLGIEYGTVSIPKNLKGYNYQSKVSANYTLTSQDIVISGSQPKSVLAQVLFEPQTAIEDSLTYDITAWSAPYFYGLDAYANTFNIEKINPVKAVANVTDEVASPYALIAKYNSVEDGTFLAALFQENLKMRILTTSTVISGKSFEPGSIVIAKTSNKEGYEKVVYDLAKKYNRKVESVRTGLATSGRDLGSADVKLLSKPKIGVIGGEGASKLSYGQIRYYFEQEIKYPYTILRTDYINSVDLDKYNVLIFPSGSYKSLAKPFKTDLTLWVKAGGKIVLVEDALSIYKNSDQSSLTTYFDEAEEKEYESEEISKEEALFTSSDRTRKYLENAIPGAIYKVTLDKSHQLAYGLEGSYYSLKTSGERYAYLKKGSNVGTIRSQNDLISGFVGKNKQKELNETIVFGTEKKGKGTMVYLVDNPLYRSFWYEGKVLFTNAVFLVD